MNPELYQLKKFGGNNRRGGGGRNNYNSQHGTFKKGSFGNSGGYGGRGGYENGGGYKKSFDNYGAGGSGGSSRFSDRKFEGAEGSRNGHSFANGHTRFN